MVVNVRGRKKIPVFSKEEKKRRSDRMKRNFDKK